jgi:muramoyltetrapeptide carboxypeptidase
MTPIFPNKLKPGDEVRVIAPSSSLGIVSKENKALAIKALEDLGLRVSFGQHVDELDLMRSSSIQSRIADLHEAFQDPKVKAILAVLGGSNSNQLLQYINYELIKANPKIFCGFSDITALQNAIFHRTGLVTYSGPQFSSFAMQKGFEYSLEYFNKIFFENKEINIHCSSMWSDDEWYLDQENRTFHPNEGYWVIHPGTASGTIIGGNVSTILLLHGTSYMPSPVNIILFLESDNITEGHGVWEFDRALQSMIHQSYFRHVKALVIGRFEEKFEMSSERLKFIIETKPELRNLPIIANVDFGHTMPTLTFPIGGTCRLEANADGKVRIVIEG